MEPLQPQAIIRVIGPRIARGAQDRVEATVKQFNHIVREHITETNQRLKPSTPAPSASQ